MPSNVEIKARVPDMELLESKARDHSGEEGKLLEQEDVFFVTPKGRLKLRHLKGQAAQLIYYERPDEEGPKTSLYHVFETENPEDLKIALSMCLGVKGVVKKRRKLFMVGQTRVHVDRVEGLGDFMELEVQMQEGQTPEEGQKIAEDLMEKLGISRDSLITGAYMDHILKKTEQNGENESPSKKIKHN
ncbi:unnamed protein product [Owenia fusiformis]|uniref:Uncharacterized protein n=1 Tax=Owenia fusiformis TaxID=6347 RepID=A0A8J1TZT1_OWEFU|nr:unnamed protein product [Owenia fusiformis]